MGHTEEQWPHSLVLTTRRRHAVAHLAHPTPWERIAGPVLVAHWRRFGPTHAKKEGREKGREVARRLEEVRREKGCRHRKSEKRSVAAGGAGGRKETEAGSKGIKVSGYYCSPSLQHSHGRVEAGRWLMERASVGMRGFTPARTATPERQRRS